MDARRTHGWAGVAGLCLVVLWTFPVAAQTFSSGSTGALGAFSPAANTTLPLPPDGVFNFTTVTIPAGVTVTFTPNAANTAVTLLATGDVTIAGTLSVNGANGPFGSGSGPIVNPGGAGGPGGFAGGQGGARGATNNGASAGQGPGGGNVPFSGGTYGAPPSFQSLLPLFGGSGGAGGAGTTTSSGGGGGGGGGAIVMASSTKLTVTGSISANGGNDGIGVLASNGCSFGTTNGAGGSGGAIRLVAPQITGTGSLQARGAAFFFSGGGGCQSGGNGVIRLEAFTLGFSGSSNPAAFTSTAPGPVTAAGTPSLINLPTLAISSVGGVASPATPGASYTTADVSLPSGTTNPIPVTLTAANIPLGTVFTVKLLPQFATATSVTSSASTGTFTSSTATASVTFPTAQVSVLNAFGSFVLPASVAALFPAIDGEPVEQVLVAADPQSSTVTLRTRSGKERRGAQLTPAERQQVIVGMAALQQNR